MRFITFGMGLFVWAIASACSSGYAPRFEEVGDQVGQVGSELKIQLLAIDPDGDHLTYAFSSNVPGLDKSDRALMARTPSDGGVFKWTPLASDVGDWYFDFIASDGNNEAKLTVKVSVKSAIGSATAPQFRRPQGQGTFFERRSGCLELAILVEDQDNATVAISQVPPIIEGSKLRLKDDGVSGTWSWCPTAEQAKAEVPYVLRLVADDKVNQTPLVYSISMRGELPQNCPGNGPVVTHMPKPYNGIIDFDVAFKVYDDQGIITVPRVYASETPLRPPFDYATLTELPVSLEEGTSLDGTYVAKVPNPAWNLPEGEARQLYYFFVVRDNDDATGSCDHETVTEVFRTTVTSTGWGDAKLCDTCTGDIQCGDDGDLCVRVGQRAHCLAACGNDSGCPAGYECSAAEVSSVENTLGRQCIPRVGVCGSIGETCRDDGAEENNFPETAKPLATGTHEFVLCPPGQGMFTNDDYYKLVVGSPSMVYLALAGGPVSDLDMTLQNREGRVVATSSQRSSNEVITQCLAAGVYYARVTMVGAAVRNTYELTYNATRQNCQ